MDVVLSDFGVNDGHPEKYYGTDPVTLAASTEALSRHVASMAAPAPALVFVEGYMACRRNDTMHKCPWATLVGAYEAADVRLKVAAALDVPMVSYRHATWPSLLEAPRADQWGGEFAAASPLPVARFPPLPPAPLLPA